MYTVAHAAFFWMTMFTAVTAGQVVLWGARYLLPCNEREKDIRGVLMRGTTFALVIFLLCEAGFILAHLNGTISLDGIL